MKSKMAILAGLVACAVTGACGTGNDTSSQERGDLPKLSQAAVTDVTWYESWDEGMAAAEKAGKPVLVHFTADWCVYCRKMKNETYTSPEIKKRFNEGWITIMIDTDDKVKTGKVYVEDSTKKALAWKNGNNDSFKAETMGHGQLLQFFGGMGLPTLLFIDKNGAPLNKISSFMPPKDLAVILDFFQQEAYDTMTFDEFKKKAESRS